MYLIFAGLFDTLLWLFTPSNWGTVIQVALGLGFVIFVHELGHFLVAKACGVKCEKFYIGFDIYGLKLFKYKWGETEYGIGILPLGGYVKMLGQDDNPYRAAEEMQRAKAHPLPSGDLPPEPTSDPHAPYDPRSYMAQTVPERMAIISAGVIMNIIFAFLMATLAYWLGVKEVPCRLSEVFAGGPAYQAGLQPEDEVIQINELKKPIYDDLRTRVPVAGPEGVDFLIKREGLPEPFWTKLHPDLRLGVPLIRVAGPQTLVLNELSPFDKHSAAAKATPELKAGDRVVEVNGVAVDSVSQFEAEMAKGSDKPATITIARPTEDPAEIKRKRIETPDYRPQSTNLTVTIPPNPLRTLGLVMTTGPIVAIQADSPAAQAGVQIGDKLLKVDGQPIDDPLLLPEVMRTSVKQGEVSKDVELTILRDGKELKFSLKPRAIDRIELPKANMTPVALTSLGLAYDVQPVVESVNADGPAAKLGILPGDKVLSATVLPPEKPLDDDEAKRYGDIDPIKLTEVGQTNWPYIFYTLQSINPTSKIRLSVQTGDETPRNVEVLPQTSDTLFHPERGVQFTMDFYIRQADTLGEAAQLGYRKTVDSLLMVYRFLQRVAQNRISPKMLGGPVTIATVAGKSAEEGFASLLLFLTMLSANLAVVNFLPIPVLDGGHMVFLMWEGITGKPPSEKVFVGLTYIGLAFILTLMLFVLGLDFGLISRG